jgi:biopolymer transport protein ExbD
MITFSKYEQQRRRKSSMNLTPLVDMMFLLLLFFILTSAVSRPAMDVALAESKTGTFVDRELFTVSLDPAGTILLDGKAITPGELAALINSEGITEAGIAVDRLTPFQNLAQTMDIFRQGQVKSLSFFTEEKK